MNSPPERIDSKSERDSDLNQENENYKSIIPFSEPVLDIEFAQQINRAITSQENKTNQNGSC